jgi:predicted permease
MQERIREWLHRLLGAFGGGRPDQDMAAEFRTHLELASEREEREGLSPEAAYRAARLSEGGAIQAMEAHRDQRGLPWLDDLRRDLAYALRNLTKSPGLSLLVIASLAVGMAGTVAALAFMNAVVFRTYPGVVGQERLVEVRVGRVFPGVGVLPEPTSPEAYATLRDGLSSLADLTAFMEARVAVGLPEARSLSAGLVAGNYFAVLDMAPGAGRMFVPGESEASTAPVTVISHRLWVGEFGADPAVVGRFIDVGGQNVQIVGVTPPGFTGLTRLDEGVDLWLPMALAGRVSEPDSLGSRFPRYVGRLADGATTEQVQAEADVVVGQIPESEAQPDPIGASVVGVGTISPEDRRALAEVIAALIAVPFFVLVIACVNAANLLLARASRREREMSLRMAIGASRRRVIGQLLVESLVLSAVAATFAVPVGWAGLRVARGFLPVAMPIDARVLLAVVVTTLATAVGFGLVPAFRATAANPARSLGMGQAGAGSTPRQFRGRRALIVVQVALSLGLLAAGTQLVSTFEALRAGGVDDPDRLLLASFDLDQLRFSPEDARLFYGQLLDRVSVLPESAAAGLAPRTAVWITGAPTLQDFIRLQDVYRVFAWKPGDAPSDGRSYQGGYVDGDLFAAAGLDFLAGRRFTDSDRTPRPGVAVVSRSFAEAMFDGPAVGRTLFVRDSSQENADAVEVSVVGVVEAIDDPLWDDFGPPGASVYLPSPLVEEPALTLYVRARDAAVPLAAAIRAAVDDLDSRVPLQELATLEEINDRAMAPQRGLARAAHVLGIVSLLLAACGLYGVTSYLAAMRSTELAVRLTLGSTPREIVRLVLGQALVTVAIGIAIGGILSVGVGVVIYSQVLNAAGFDAVAVAGSALFLGLTMLVASVVPSLRAARLDPMAVLRHE